MFATMDATFELNALRELVSTLQASLATVRLENQLLRQKLDALARRFFGVSSEALNPAQLQLLLQMPELSAKPAEKSSTPIVVEKPRPARQACRTTCLSSKR